MATAAKRRFADNAMTVLGWLSAGSIIRRKKHLKYWTKKLSGDGMERAKERIFYNHYHYCPNVADITAYKPLGLSK